MKFNLRLLYLYLFSFVGLLITIIGSIGLLDLTFRTYVFRVDERSYYPEPVMVEGKSTYTKEDLEKRAQTEADNSKKRQLSNDLAMILVGTPLYLYHWQTIKKESKKGK